MENKQHAEKLDWGLLPWGALADVVKVFEGGRAKYGGRYTWRRGIKYSYLIAAIFRHLIVFLNGEDIDKESGCSHLAHVAANALMLLEISSEWDDRPHQMPQVER